MTGTRTHDLQGGSQGANQLRHRRKDNKLINHIETEIVWSHYWLIWLYQDHHTGYCKRRQRKWQKKR